jgi:hypothetical protein
MHIAIPGSLGVGPRDIAVANPRRLRDTRMRSLLAKMIHLEASPCSDTC